MSLEADQAHRIWSFPVDGRHPEVQPFTLAELMHGIPDHPNYLVQRGSCLVMGVHSMPKSAEEFNAIIKQEADEAIKTYLQNNKQVDISDEQIQRLSLRLRENYCGEHTTPLRVFRYVNTDGSSMADGMPYQGILTDMKWLGILYFDTQEITILPYGDPKDGPHRMLFYDARAKIAGSRWGYDGSLDTALAEFSRRGFTLHTARLASTPEDHRQFMAEHLNTPANRRIKGIITGTNLPLEQVLQVISQNPQI